MSLAPSPLASQTRVSQPLTDDAADGLYKAAEICGLAIVETIRLLVQIAEQVERLNRNIGALDRTLQQTPVVLKPVRVYLTIDVRLGMVDYVMNEPARAIGTSRGEPVCPS